jgi:hypothetical protein
MEQHLVAALEGTLSPDASIRTQAETGLLQAHADPSCGLALCHIVLNTQAPLRLRQSAAVSLRKWIRERWSPLAEAFIGFPPEGRPVQSENKGGVRQALLQILALPGQGERKLRVAAAACLSLVCSSDWPDEFPELLPSVHQMLQSTGSVSVEDRDRVHGALAFLCEFWSSEMDERQILGGAKDMLPTIEALLADTQVSPSMLGMYVGPHRGIPTDEHMFHFTLPDAGLPSITSLSLCPHLPATAIFPVHGPGSIPRSVQADRQ